MFIAGCLMNLENKRPTFLAWWIPTSILVPHLAATAGGWGGKFLRLMIILVPTGQCLVKGSVHMQSMIQYHL